MTDKSPQEYDWVESAKDEVQGMAKQGMKHPSTPPVLTGAAIGAVAGLVAGSILPVVSWPLGLAAGAGYALHQRIKR